MIKFNRLSQYKINKIILYFCEDITATSAAKILGLNRNMVNLYYNHLRELIVQQSFKENIQKFGVFELDESCFGFTNTWQKPC